MAQDNETTVRDVLIAETAKKIKPIEEGDFKALQRKARDFIQVVQEVANMQRIMMSRARLADAIHYVVENMKNERANTSKIVDAQHIFETHINEFMGRTSYLTYVSDTGRLSFFNEVNTGKLYHEYITKGAGVGKFQTALPDDWSDLAKELNDRIQTSAAQKAWTYTTAIKRWEKNGKPETMMNYENAYHTFYWRLYDHHVTCWTNRIENRGHIAEAYARGVIEKNESINSSQGESALAALYGIIRNDSTSGVLEGDVKINDNGEIHFAVKSGSFQTPRSSQYIKLAYNVIQMPPMSVKEFEEALPKLLRIDNISKAFVEEARRKAEEEAKKTAEAAVST